MSREIKLEDLPKLPPQQLAAMVRQFEGEIKFFEGSLSELKTVVASFKRSQDALNGMVEMGEDRQCLVPLTDTIYVKGKTSSCEKFLIDIGTGYYAEMTPIEANNMFNRKREFVEKQIKQIEGSLLPSKKLNLEFTYSALKKITDEVKGVTSPASGGPQSIAMKSK
jgi:prefoldin alpha subunit|uniref:Prefoldin subunit 5 n=1 Tax=Panagrolaimus sp. PS1159 TaxID=55785 RepID=A0AC35GLL3_9BILA